MEPFIGEIRIFAGINIPDGWAACDGSLVNINDYQALYALISTTYGGDGVTTFALPNLIGRVPVGVGTGPGLSTRTLGEQGGTEEVTLTSAQMPAHTHVLSASTAPGTTAMPGNTVSYAKTDSNIHPYVDLTQPTTAPLTFAANAITSVGGSMGHDNMMPSVAIKYMIATDGIYPS